MDYSSAKKRLYQDVEPSPSTSSLSSSDLTTVKGKRRMVSYSRNITEMFPFITKAGMDHYVNCSICKKDFSIGHGGLNDVKRHVLSKSHVNSAAVKKQQPTVSSLFKSCDYTPIQLATIAAEVKFSNFLVEHNLPLATADHAGDLFRSMFLNSDQPNVSTTEVIKNFKCGRTKTTHIVNKLAQTKIEHLVSAMQTRPFNLATD